MSSATKVGVRMLYMSSGYLSHSDRTLSARWEVARVAGIIHSKYLASTVRHMSLPTERATVQRHVRRQRNPTMVPEKLNHDTSFHSPHD